MEAGSMISAFLKNRLPKVLSRIRLWTEKPIIENGILRGRDDWLFLWTGTNEVNRFYTEPDFFTDQHLEQWGATFERRVSKSEELGATYRHIVVPDKLSVYSKYVTAPLPYFKRKPTTQLKNAFGHHEYYVDVLPALREGDPHPDGQYHFLKTDSHWTSRGCTVAYRELCKSLGIEPLDFEDRHIGKGRVLTLDLGNKLDPPVTEHARFASIPLNAKRVSENEMVRYNESEGFQKGQPRFLGCRVHYQNPHPDALQKTVVLFGDSFSEIRMHLMTAMLSETFRDVHFVWSTDLDFDFIASCKPDIIVTEIAERFCRRIPKDDFKVTVD
jgi:hypothetical protein